MDSTNGNGAELESANGSGVPDALPPPPPVIPPNVEPLKVKTEPVEKKNLRVPMARSGFGSKGQKIPLLTNHFKVNVANLQGHFYHYSVCFCYRYVFSFLFCYLVLDDVKRMGIILWF